MANSPTVRIKVMAARGAEGTATPELLAARDAALAAATAAQGQAESAQSDAALVATALSEPPDRYATYAAAVADLGAIADQAEFTILSDEAAGGHRTLNRKESGGIVRIFDYNQHEVAFRRSAQRSRARLALIFDDGFRNNLTVAAPILARYGFAATMALESDRAGYIYGGDPNYPVCDGADLRALVGLGWEIGNHPFVNIAAWTEAQFVQYAHEDNQLIRDLLTGAKIPGAAPSAWPGWAGAHHVAAVPTHPEFAAYPVETVVYRGGDRNVTSDRAYRAVPYNIIRSIAGPESSAGKVQSGAQEDGPFGRHWFPAVVCDTSGDKVIGDTAVLQTVLAYIRGLAATGADGLMYAHSTPGETPPVGATHLVPWVPTSHLVAICELAHSLGVQIVPMSALGAANVLRDSSFIDQSTGTFGGASGWDTGTTLDGLPRSLRIQYGSYSANAGNINFGAFQSRQFRCRPWTWYRVRFRYLIPADLTLSGGTGNTNHGLAFGLNTNRQDAPSNQDLVVDDYVVKRMTDAAYARRYAATAGLWEEVDVDLFTGQGNSAALYIGLFNATGTVYIGTISIERGASLRRRPLRGSSTFNTTIARTIALPVSSTADGLWEWDFSIISDTVYDFNTYGVTQTVNYAFSDSASITSPTNGQTAYVLNPGAGAFAGKPGQIATWNGSAWTFTNPADMTFIKVTTSAEGLANQYFFHVTRGTTAAQYERCFGQPTFDDWANVRKGTSDAQRLVFGRSGKRSDAFTWQAQPRLLSNPLGG